VNRAIRNSRKAVSLVSNATIFLLLFLGLSEAGGLFAQQRARTNTSQDQPLRSLSMVSADFDEDGVADLAIGYALGKGGSISLMRGNHDAIAPQSHASWLAAGRHEPTVPFLQAEQTIKVSAEPDMLAAADVDGDGHLDLVYATKGSRVLNVILGTGKGSFLPNPASITLPGRITAVASYRPGSPILGEALLVGYRSKQGAKLAILTYGATGLKVRATYSLPGNAAAFSVTNLDDDLIPDAAIVAGGQLLVLHGSNAISGGGRLEVLPVDNVETVTSGEFLFDRHGLMQLAALTSDGSVLILAHQGLDPRPFTPQEIGSARHLRPGSPTLAQLAGNIANEPWTVVETNAQAGAHPTGSDVPILLRSRMSGSGGDDLVVLNSSQQQRVTIRHSMGTSRESNSTPSRIATTSLRSSDALVAAASLRVSADARSGLVMLVKNSPMPEITVPAAGNTFYVNTFADNTGTTTDAADGTRCSNGSSETCTLRDAVTFVNKDASDNISGGNSDTIMLPAGTYSLTWQAGTVDSNSNAITHLEVLGPATFVGDTTSPGVTINAKSNDVAFTINPGPYGSFNPSGDSYVFDTELENITIENGSNPDNLSVNANANDVGGGINWDADGAGNLTLDNITIENCTVLYGAGGGLWVENSAGSGSGTVTLTGGTISGNSTAEQGGGVYVAYPYATLKATNTVITSNVAEPSVNTKDPGGDGAGGGLFFNGRTSTSASPQSTLTGVTISSNSVAVEGGGIYTNSGILVTNSAISSNTSGEWGGGVYAEEATGETTTTVTSSNILDNSATTDGGGAYVGDDNPSTSVPSLTMSLSRIFGNTSTSGTSGLALEGSGAAMATDNWWGCNAGPSNASCNKADSAATTNPWAVLTIGASPSSIVLGNDFNLTVGLNRDSNGASISGAFPAVSGDAFAFGSTVVTGTFAPTSGTFSSAGSDTATFTPSIGGVGTVEAIFDNETASANITVEALKNFTVSAPSTATAGVAFNITVTANQTTGGTFTSYLGTVTFSSTDGAATLPANYTFVTADNGVHQFSVTLNTGGNQTVTATDTVTASATGTSGNINVSVPAVGTTTALSPSSTTVYTTSPANSETLTATVTSTSSVNSGTVTFQDGGVNLSCAGGNPATVSSGTAICVTSFSAEGIHALSANYNGGTGFLASSGSANIYAQNHSGNSGNTYCNTGAITASGQSESSYSQTTPYPSVIFVGDGVNTDITVPASTVSLELKGFSASAMASTHMLLVSPDGTHAFDFLSAAGTSASLGNYVFSDSASSLASGALSPGTYLPTSSNTSADLFTPGPPLPAPQLPSSFMYAPTYGSASFASVFDGATAHGAWSLFFYDANGSGEGGSATGGWCLSISVTPSSMAANAGTTPQTATVNTAFANALAVTVEDSSSHPVPGVNVTFTAPSTGVSGTFSNSTNTITVATNSSGIASAPFTANSAAGGPYTVTAASSGLTTVDFSLTNAAGAPSTMVANAGTTPQSTQVSTTFANALAVTVKDASSNPVSGVNVTFTGPASGASGTFSSTTNTIVVATNSSGVASAPFTANSTAGGPYTVTAASSGLTTVNFSLTNNTGAASSMTADPGTTPQTTTVNTAFANALAVTVKDALSNPVSGVNVTFTGPASGTSGTFSNSTNTITVATNSSGIASAPFTANSMAGGPYNVSASASGLTTVNFSLTNAAGAAASMTANAGTTPQTTTVTTAFANPLAVTVKDALSNPVSGVNVTFTGPSSGAGGTFSNSSNTIIVATNSSGVASAPFTANSAAGGPYTVTAASSGLTTVNFSLTNNAGAASSMTANAGTTPQTATVLTSFANPLSVTVKDASSNPVSGVSVTFTGPASGASGTFSNSTATITVATNSSGVASAPITANSIAGGPYNVSASSSGLTTVNFSLTNTAGAAASMTANAGTTPQSAIINTAFANALAVTVKDASSNPVSGVNVTFTGPASGASGTFSNSSNTIVVATNASGVASAPFTANSTPGGPYTATASASGLTTVSFSLTNTPLALSVTCSATNAGTVNVPFSSGPETVTGGVTPYTFYVGSGAIPNGLGLNSSTGAITGTPATSGAFTIDVKDSTNTVAATGCPFTITAPALVISWSTPAAITYGTSLSTTQLDASANEPGTFVYDPAAGTVLKAGLQTLSATFTPTDTKDYNVTVVHVTLQVNKATPVLAWSPASIQIGSKLGAAQLDATANVPGKFVYTPPSGTEVSTPVEILKVVFTPSDTNDYTTADMSVSLEVTTISVSPSSINFGTVYLDSVTTKDVTVTNLGPESATVSDPLISILTQGDSREFVVFNLCPKTLAAHKSCTMEVQYVAGPFYDEQSATLSVKDSSPGSPQKVSLTALTIDPQAKLSATSLSFGAQKENTSSTAKPVTITNTGATPLTIDNVGVTGSDPLDFIVANHCPKSLAAGLNCSIDVTFKPKAKGSRSAKLVITDNAQNSPQGVSLSGTGD
jgi:CSLREA domain-containing protein